MTPRQRQLTNATYRTELILSDHNSRNHYVEKSIPAVQRNVKQICAMRLLDTTLHGTFGR